MGLSFATFSRRIQIIAIIFLFAANCKTRGRKKGGDQLAAGSQCYEVNLVNPAPADTIKKEDFHLKAIDTSLDLDTVNYIKLSFTPEKDDSLTHFVEYMVCAENNCLCADALYQATKTCHKSEQSLYKRYARSYLFEENIRIPTTFFGNISVIARLCYEKNGKINCGSPRTKKEELEFFATTEQDDPQDTAILEEGARIFALVDELSARFTHFSLDQGKDVKSLAHNFSANSSQVKGMLVHHEGAQVFARTGQFLEEDFESQCAPIQTLALAGKKTQYRDLAGQDIFLGATTSNPARNMYRVYEHADAVRKLQDNPTDLSIFRKDPEVLRAYNTNMKGTLKSLFDPLEENRLIRDGYDKVIGYLDPAGNSPKYYYGTFTENSLPAKNSDVVYHMRLEEGFPPSNVANRFSEDVDYLYKFRQNLTDFPMATGVTAQNPKRIIVSGGGPGGLVAALEAIDKGHHVTLLEGRSAFTRGQILILDNKTLDILDNIAGKNNIAALRKAGIIGEAAGKSTIAIKNLQNVLLAAIDARATQYPDRVNIQMRSRLEFEARVVNGKKVLNPIIVSHGGKEFSSISGKIDMIVGADSNQSRVREASGIRQRNISNRTYAYTAVMDIKRPVPGGLENLGYARGKRLAASLHTQNKIGGQLYFYGEMSKSEFREYSQLADDPEQQRRWLIDNHVQSGLTDTNGVTKSNFADYFEASSVKGDVAAFPIELTQADRTAGEINTSQGKVRSVLVGDAGASTSFFQASGANRAIFSASILELAFREAESAENWSKAVADRFDFINEGSINEMQKDAFKFSKGNAKNPNIRLRFPKIKPQKFSPLLGEVKIKAPQLKGRGASGIFSRLFAKSLLLSQGPAESGLPQPINDISEKIVQAKLKYDCLLGARRQGYDRLLCDGL